jgi:hypothetical protein
MIVAGAQDNGPSVFIRPGETGYQEATGSWNLAACVQPEQVAVVRSVPEVVEALSQARRAHRLVRMMATGHGATAQAPFTHSLLLRTEFTADVVVDSARRTARIPAGASWDAVVTASAAHDLVAMHGSCGTVGAVGYLLRGGVSFYGRRFGLAANSIRSITLVLADGQVTVTDDDRDPDLFWALRGGGGGFGVVTEVEIDLHPMSAVVTGTTFWDARDAEAVARHWGRWSDDAPLNISTSLRFLNIPAGERVPPILTGRQIVALDGAVAIATPAEREQGERTAADLLEPLRALVAPLADTWHVGHPRELLQTHLDPHDPLPYAGNHTLVRDLGDEGIARFVAAAGPGSNTSLTAAELRQLGGAFAQPDPGGGALNSIDAHFAHLAIGATSGPATMERVRSDLRQVAAALGPWTTGMTVPSVVESYDAVQRSFDDETVRAVDTVRRTVDPVGLFRGDVDPVRDHVDAFSGAMAARVGEPVTGHRRDGLES